MFSVVLELCSSTIHGLDAVDRLRTMGLEVDSRFEVSYSTVAVMGLTEEFARQYTEIFKSRNSPSLYIKLKDLTGSDLYRSGERGTYKIGGRILMENQDRLEELARIACEDRVKAIRAEEDEDEDE